MEIYVVHAQKARAIISSGHFGLYKNYFSFAFWWGGGGLGVDGNLCCLSSHSRDKLMNRLCGFLVRITDNITCKETN